HAAAVAGAAVVDPDIPLVNAVAADCPLRLARLLNLGAGSDATEAGRVEGGCLEPDILLRRAETVQRHGVGLARRQAHAASLGNGIEDDCPAHRKGAIRVARAMCNPVVAQTVR